AKDAHRDLAAIRDENLFEHRGDVLRLADFEELLPELDGFAVLDEDVDNRPGDVRFDLVHQLHRLDDAERLTRFDDSAHFDEGRRIGGGGAIEGADEGRRNVDDALLFLLGFDLDGGLRGGR